MKLLRFSLAALLSMFTAAVLLAAGLYLYIAPQLPSIDVLRDVRFQVPLRVYSQDGRLISEYGEKRRAPVAYDDLPPQVIHAFLAAEDDRFFQHPGVDYQGLVRAAIELVRTGEKRQGGSTITMQVARNFFLSSEKTYLRKVTEIILALRIEHELTKQQILELYLNKIYLGQRAYGVGAAAQIYYGVSIDKLTLPQIAMIAGLPKAPSRDNPISNPERAVIRRNYVLGRMHDLHYIDDAVYQQAIAAPDHASLHKVTTELDAAYVGEMVRAYMVDRYGEAAYTDGYKVTTTLREPNQVAATRALQAALVAYDRRHGYRGPEAHHDLAATDDAEAIAALIDDSRSIGGLVPAVVTQVDGQRFTALTRQAEHVEVDWDGMDWARPYIDNNRRGAAPKQAGDIVQPGDVVRLQQTDAGWRLAQIPRIEGALVSLNPDSGAVLALVGGFDYFRSKFNRAVQAERQPGSSFKPFIYSAALNKGFTAATIINDAPVVFNDPSLEGAWRPENYSGRFFGPTRLREALIHSRNLVSIRILRAIGVPYAIDYVQRFGFRPDQLPANLSLSLGSASVTPMEMARGYAVFANGGYRVEPYFIQQIQNADGEMIYQARPHVVCRDCPDQANTVADTVTSEDTQPAIAAPPETTAAPAATTEAVLPPAPAERVVDAQNVWLMDSLLADVIKHGTGRRALQLGRTDLHGKTGTTNDQRDAWFCGFTPAVVTISWVGFDEVAPLGRGETGARAALPMWMDYMRTVLAGTPEIHRDPPPGLVSVRIDPETGLLAPSSQADAIFETFRQDHVPTKYSTDGTGTMEGGNGSSTTGEPLF